MAFALENPEMQILTCTDPRGNSSDFEYSVSRDVRATTWTYRVRPKGADAYSNFFELSVVELDASAVRVTMINNHNHPPVSAKGIPDALLPHIARELGRQVQSSPGSGPAGDVYRTEAATKVWQRLKKNGKADFDEPRDIYYTV